MNEQPTAAAPASTPAPVAAVPEGPIVPDVWPGAWGILKNSKRAVMNNVQAFLIALLPPAVLSIVTSNNKSLIVSLITYVFSAFMATVLIYVSLGAARGEKVDIGKIFNDSLKTFWKLAIVTFIMVFAFVAGFIFFIVPGVYLLSRLSLTPYFLLDQNMGIGDALNASWAQSKGHGGKIWGIIGVSLVFGLGVLILVGIYFTFIYSAAMAILYLYVKNHQAVAAPVAPTPPATS